MNVTLYGPYGWWSPHFETELELMELHLEQGDGVTFIICDAALGCCEINPKHDFAQCVQCFGRAREGIKRLSRPVRVLRLSELIVQAKEAMTALQVLPKSYGSFAELYQLKVQNFDLGAAVLSTLNSHLEDPDPDPSVHHELTWSILSAAYAAYSALDRYLSKNVCDLFYLLNGRIANFRAALRACQRHGVRCLVHERGSDLNSYTLAENTMPHDPSHVKKYFAATLAKAESLEQKEVIARQFYSERREGKIANWVSFTEQQVRGSVPEGWLESPVRIAAFSSTESEFACLREFFPQPIHASQAEGFERIIHDLARNQFNGIFVVRIHPNSAGTKADFTERLRALPYAFFRIIAPDDKVDSYALLQTAQKILSFGSTMGIEGAYWGVPSIVARWAAYQDLGSTYNPTSHAELMDLLLRPLDPKPIAGAIDYGFYAKRFGTRLKYVTPLGTFYAAFKGAPIQPEWPYRQLAGRLAGKPNNWWSFAWNSWEKKRQKALCRGNRFFLDPLRLLIAWERKRLSPDDV